MAVTIYTPSPALGTNDGNNDTNFRVFVQASADSNGQIRVSFRAHTSNNLGIVGAAIGKWDGGPIGSGASDMTTAPHRLLFGGANGVTIPSGTTTTSDFVTHSNFTFVTGEWLIVTFYCSSNGWQRYSSGHTTATTMFKAIAVDYSQAQNAAAMGNGVSTVGNVQPGGSGGYNFSVDLVETNDPAGDISGTSSIAFGATGNLIGLAPLSGTTSLSYSLSNPELKGTGAISGTSFLTFTVAQAGTPSYPNGNMVAGAIINMRYTLQLNQDYY